MGNSSISGIFSTSGAWGLTVCVFYNFCKHIVLTKSTPNARLAFGETKERV